MSEAHALELPISTAITADQNIVVTTDPGKVSANQIGVDYNGPNANQPSTYGNVLYIWQSGEAIPWSSDAKNFAAVIGNSPAGSQSFDQLNVTTLSYIIGYAVGPILNASWSKYSNVVAYTYVPAIGGGDIVSVKSTVGVASLGSTSLVTNINLLPGFNPSGSSTWVGVWEGQSASYNQKPKWRAPALSSSASSTVSLNNIMLTRGTTYTIGLFATGYSSDDSQLKQSSLAATHTFTV